MKKWLRRIRAAAKLGLLWAGAWFAAGMALLVVVGVGAADVPFPLFFGFLGFWAGVAFSGILGLVEGRRSFEEMSLPRFALWGGVGGAALATVLSALLGGAAFTVLVPVFGLAGAACAGSTLALARMAEGGGALESVEDIDGIGLSEDEVRELLGDGK